MFTTPWSKLILNHLQGTYRGPKIKKIWHEVSTYNINKEKNIGNVTIIGFIIEKTIITYVYVQTKSKNITNV